MNRHLHSPTTLTEFARDFEEEPNTIFTKIVTKLQNVYNTGYNTINELPSESMSPIPPTASQSTVNADLSSPVSRTSSHSSLSSAKPTTNQKTESSSTSTADDISESLDKPESDGGEGRTMVNVLKRISNIVATKNNNLRNYKDTDLHRFWMPDAKAIECYDCSQKFSTFRRKHHCRLCGQIFCSNCCNQVVPGKIIMCAGDLKVCNYCSKIVLSYLKSPDITQDLKSDLLALQEDLSSKLSQSAGNSESRLPVHQVVSSARKISVGYQEERFVSNAPNSLSNADRKNILQQSNSLKTLHDEMIRLLSLQNCGTDLIDFLNDHHKASNKPQAIAILNAMLEAGFLLPLVPDSDQLDFEENLHYKFAPKSNIAINIDDDLSPVHLNQQQENDRNTNYQSALQPPKSLEGSSSFQTIQDFELENSMRSSITSTKFVESYCDHEELLSNQILRNFNLDQSWSKILIPLCAQAANHFKPEYCTNDLMDIRNYVNFKKIPGGSRKHSTLVEGVVFSKNVAHKNMATSVKRPKILLLQCPIVYERVEGKFVSISTVLLQEKEYLRNVTARIMGLKPNVVLVHKNVAGIAQDMLRSNGITLVLDVKMSVMERLSKCLQCEILTSIDANIGQPKLGLCDRFYIENFDDGNGSSKTLMFFEKLSTCRSYSYLLRGASNTELAKVKKCASLLLYARYNWRLEMSFLIDEFARPLSPKLIIFDSKEQSPSDDIVMATNKESNVSDKKKVNVLAIEETKIHKRLTERKSEEKMVVIENVSDFTDPLRAAELSPTKYDANQTIVELAVETPYDNRFRTAISSTILSVSPHTSFPLPYLETENGRKCTLRSLFPNELYFSKQWSTNNEKSAHNESVRIIEQSSVKLNPLHPFVTHKITTPFDNRDLQTLLAEFRAFGGRYPRTNNVMKFFKRTDVYQKPQKGIEDHLYKDALDLENHQRLPVLFCSFYYNPKAASLCAHPTRLNMKFYGQHDIMLGQFLHRYCFRSSYICPSCKLPMMDHVRRYVHSMGCVQVYMNEDISKNDTSQIYLTSWCSICNKMTPSAPISETTKCLSFAKYLELRFHGHAYKTLLSDECKDENSEVNERCEHSLHRDYIHYFTYKGIGVQFKYTAIQAWEIGLPPLVLHMKKPKPFDNLQVLEDIKNFSMKGHEVYSKIHERIADYATDDESPALNNLTGILNRDQFIFRQHVEIVQTLLTEKEANSYDLNDAMLMAKRALAESIELWGPRLNDAALQAKLIQKQESNSHIDSGLVCTEVLKTDPESPTSENKSIRDGIEDKIESDVEMPSPPQIKPKESKTTESVSDKKSIKQILSHLLPSTSNINSLQSPLSQNEHLTLPLGSFPILVHDQDLSSIIAFCLTSNDYKKVIENMQNAVPSANPNDGNSCSPNLKRKSNDGTTDSDEKSSPKLEDDKKTKSLSHVELNFQDLTMQFSCKIYFAREFDKLRANVLKPPNIEKSLYKELEQFKKREELKVSQKNSSPEIELIRKSNNNLPPLKTVEGGVAAQSNDIIDARTYLARSLCRSVQWEARGGKSGSKFCKTLDDRFVLKEMSKGDVCIFENFAPNYFEYIEKCLLQEKPTLLAKILGVFKVTIKKKDSLLEKSLLVMENLFYDCDIKNKFDLKGSERNRLVDPTNQNGETVLLDENLVQMSWSNPLYILSHSKTILKEAINRDASFLERNEVMDYSLLVGLNDKDNVLVLGIIDYIRTFTFDKRLESLVKQSGLLGGQGKLPTVISPQPYKHRFIEAMDRYFYSVPDRWEGFSKK